jgi:uncharacterized protein
MTRLLFWIAIVILVVWAVRSKFRAMMAPYREGAAPGPGPYQGPAPGTRRVRDDAESMSCCAACGIYFPSSEAVRMDGRDYCSPAHAHQPVMRKPTIDKAD